MSYTLALNYSFGPKYSPSTEHQIYSKLGQPGLKHIVDTEVSMCAVKLMVLHILTHTHTFTHTFTHTQHTHIYTQTDTHKHTHTHT